MRKKLDLFGGLLEYFKLTVYACFLQFPRMLMLPQKKRRHPGDECAQSYFYCRVQYL
ncbi:hypothetical protein PS903_02122 [Pseudomonas fluorescens]|nr:hypothetical protein PS903_02122 [Pseudomonas fluorescens]